MPNFMNVDEIFLVYQIKIEEEEAGTSLCRKTVGYYPFLFIYVLMWCGLIVDTLPK